MTRKLQEQNPTKTESKAVSILRCFRKNKNIISGSVVPEGKDGAVSSWACCYFGSAQDKLPGTRRRLLGKKQS